MSPNKQTVERYLDGFRKTDHAQILSCLTDDIVWELPGIFKLEGKEAFDKEIENDAFEGSPSITVHRMIEEGDAVVAEMTIESRKKDGSPFRALFCDVFVMKDAKIKRLTSYMAQLPAA